LRRTGRLEEKQEFAKQRAMRRVTKIALIAVVVGGSVGAFVWYLASRPPVPEGEIVSRNELHWHPELAIYVKGVKQEIPADIGIGAVHQPIHTHDATGTLHLEFQGLVRKHDITLGQFFKNWGRDMQSFGGNVKMTVDGEENTEFENYVMQDKDKVELRFE